jgi:hypothetical protein
VVDAHGGRIWAESDEGGGSKFHFVLPIAAGTSDVRPSEGDTGEHAVRSAPDGGHERIDQVVKEEV